MKLYEPLPEALSIDGKVYPVNTDFRVMVKFSIGIQDRILSSEQVMEAALSEFYTDSRPPDKAIQGLMEFYEGGSARKESVDHTRAFDFDCDSEYLAAAFRQQYGINLTMCDYMHWWEFKAYFKALADDTQLAKIIGYRSAKTDKMSKDMKAFYNRMKKEYALPPVKGDALAADKIMDKILGGSNG